MAHGFSSYACAEDGYFKRTHTASIDGDIWLDNGWFFVEKKTHPHHGGRRCPTAVMVPCPWHCQSQQSANMMRSKSMLLKLEDIIVFIIF
jgi:hypothetical protein